MPRYLASRHAIDRLLERFPTLAPIAGKGVAAGKWLSRGATRAKVVAQQAGMDLLLRLEFSLAEGPTPVFLPITPTGRGDAWVIRTVLTKEQANANLAQRDERHRAAWREQKTCGRRSGRNR